MRFDAERFARDADVFGEGSLEAPGSTERIFIRSIDDKKVTIKKRFTSRARPPRDRFAGRFFAGTGRRVDSSRPGRKRASAIASCAIFPTGRSIARAKCGTLARAGAERCAAARAHKAGERMAKDDAGEGSPV